MDPEQTKRMAVLEKKRSLGDEEVREYMGLLDIQDREEMMQIDEDYGEQGGIPEEVALDGEDNLEIQQRDEQEMDVGYDQPPELAARLFEEGRLDLEEAPVFGQGPNPEFRSKSGEIWTAVPPPTHKAGPQDIIRHRQGPSFQARNIDSVLSSFKAFLGDDLSRSIAHCTNLFGERVQPGKSGWGRCRMGTD